MRVAAAADSEEFIKRVRHRRALRGTQRDTDARCVAVKVDLHVVVAEFDRADDADEKGALLVDRAGAPEDVGVSG